MSDSFPKKLLEAIVSQLIQCQQILSKNQSFARAYRTVKARHLLEDIYLHEQMLGDTVRLNAYREAVNRYVTGKDCVVDLGTGTGILAFLAAAKNPLKIYALDRSKKLVEYAKSVAARNGISNANFIVSAGHKFRPAEPIDVIIQEQMGIALFDEGMLDTIMDLRDRCLKSGGRILPSKFEFYVEPVQLIKQARIAMIQERRPYGLTFPPMPISTMDYYFREIGPRDVDFLLCDPLPIYKFDLTTLYPEQIPKSFSARKAVVRSGQVDGICIYFKAFFDDDIMFSTGPEAPITHWPMLLYRVPANVFLPGENIDIQIEARELTDYLSWKFEIQACKITCNDNV